MIFFSKLWACLVGLWHAVRGLLFSLFYESYLTQILFLLFLFTLPFFLRWLRRLCLLAKIRRLCRRKAYAFRAHRRFYSLGNFQNAQCEFSVVTQTRAFAVKLVGTKRKNHHLRLLDEKNLEIVKQGRLLQQSRTSAHRARLSKLPNGTKWYPHPAWEFYTYAARELPTECVLLCHPTPGVVTVKRARRSAFSGDFELVRLSDGMQVFDMVYHTPEGFLNRLESLQEGYRLYTE